MDVGAPTRAGAPAAAIEVDPHRAVLAGVPGERRGMPPASGVDGCRGRAFRWSCRSASYSAPRRRNRARGRHAHRPHATPAAARAVIRGPGAPGAPGRLADRACKARYRPSRLTVGVRGLASATGGSEGRWGGAAGASAKVGRPATLARPRRGRGEKAGATRRPGTPRRLRVLAVVIGPTGLTVRSPAAPVLAPAGPGSGLR